MGCFNHLKLLMLMTVLCNDIERTSSVSPPSWQCKSAYCSDKQPPTSNEVTFTDKPSPATLAIGCLGRQVDLICCTAHFDHILWQYRVGNTWKDFLSIDPVNRCLSDKNQTASITNSLSRKHEGMYRCLAYGHDGAVIFNEVKLVTQDCYEFYGPPRRTILLKDVNPVPVDLGQTVDVPCSGFFGNLTLCGNFCQMGWSHYPYNLSDFEHVSDNSSHRVYTSKTPREGNQLHSRLHVKNVTDADYRGWYECWLTIALSGTANRTLVRFEPRKSFAVPAPNVWKTPAIVCGSVLVFAAGLSVVVWPFRHYIQLAVKQRKRTPPSAEGLTHDVLLLHAESEVMNEFGDFLRSRLTEFSKPPYEVYREPQFGQGLFRAMSDSLTTSRCAIVVLCPTFIAGYNERWFHLENLITDIDVIYVLYGGLDKATVTQNTMLGAEIKASIRNSCCLTWSWPLEDAKQRRQEKVNISKFFCHLKLAIPQRRRRTTAAGVVESGRPRIESTESCDSATDVHRRLLPTTASHHPVHANIV